VHGSGPRLRLHFGLCHGSSLNLYDSQFICGSSSISEVIIELQGFLPDFLRKYRDMFDRRSISGGVRCHGKERM